MLKEAWKALGVLKLLIGSLLDSNSRYHLVRSLRAFAHSGPAECNFCGYIGKFQTHGYTARLAVACPRCGSVDRHRLLMLASRAGLFDLADKRVLHFAPEPAVAGLVKDFSPSEYMTADIQPGRADMVLNIEAMALPARSVDVVIASHVLEHVDDRSALAEIHRVLIPKGVLLAMVPLVEGWDETYEDATKLSEPERAEHFGQPDHVRYYGADFRDRVKDAGFDLEEFTATGAECVRYRLHRGEKVFLATKRDSRAIHPTVTDGGL